MKVRPFSVKPEADDEIGAVAPMPREARRKAIDAAFKDLAANHARVTPGGVPSGPLKKPRAARGITGKLAMEVLKELIRDPEAAEDYLEMFGDAETAVAAFLRDKKAFLAGKSGALYAALTTDEGRDED